MNIEVIPIFEVVCHMFREILFTPLKVFVAQYKNLKVFALQLIDILLCQYAINCVQYSIWKLLDSFDKFFIIVAI